MNKEREVEVKRNLKLLIPAAILLMTSSFFFGITADLPHVPFFTSLLMIFSLLRRKPVRFNDRTLIYSAVAVLVLAVLFDFVFPIDRDRFRLISYFLRPQLSVPVALYGAALITLFNAGGWMTGIAAGAAFYTIMLGGDFYLQTPVNQRFPFFDFILLNTDRYYTVMIIVEAVITLLAFRMAMPSLLMKASARMRRYRNLVILIAAVILPLAAWGLIVTFSYYGQELRRLENLFIRSGSRWRPRGAHQFFSERVNLRSTVGAQMKQNRNQVVMRVYTKKVPGYLRARAYLRYQDGGWSGAEKKNVDPTTKGGGKVEDRERLSEKKYDGVISYKTFWYRRYGDNRNNPMLIVPASGFRSKVLPVPGNSGCFDIIADQMWASRDGVITPEDWTQDGGYTAYSPAYRSEAAYQYPLSPLKINEYFAVPENLREPLNKIIKDIMAKAPAGKESDTRTAAVFINFFREKFEYHIGDFDAFNEDPVLKFIKTERKGHCELFAASMTLMLRQKGIPARYVTGFVCEDQHPSKEYFAARVGNAHAWVEAYLRDQKKWVLLEPTPPSGVPNFKGEWGSVDSWTDRISGFLRMLLADMRRGFYAKMIVTAFSGLFGLMYDFALHPIRGPLLLALAYLLWRHWRKRRKRKVYEFKFEPEREAIIDEYNSLIQRLGKRFKLDCPKDMTPSQFSDVIASDIPGLKDEVNTFVKKYIKLRYGKDLPALAEIDEIKECVEQIISKSKGIKKRSAASKSDNAGK